jgi:hypothetical protein
MAGIAEDALLIPLAGGSHTMVSAPGLDDSDRRYRKRADGNWCSQEKSNL